MEDKSGSAKQNSLARYSLRHDVYLKNIALTAVGSEVKLLLGAAVGFFVVGTAVTGAGVGA